MGSEWDMFARGIENDLKAISDTIIEEIGKEIGTLKPIYFSESSVGGYGIMFGNTFGMILAHILLVLIGISAIVGFFTIVKWILGSRKRRMDPHEKWLKTGRMD